MQSVQSKYLMVGDIRTHYLEAGSGPPVILLHSAEFGACAELTWEFTIEDLARHFHVYAPDWLGFGKTAKWFSFESMFWARVEHIRRFLEALCIERAHFVGNSMGAGTLLAVAAMEKPAWPLERIVVSNGGGDFPNEDIRQFMINYDCTREYMRRMVQTLFFNPRIREDEEYIERRYQLSLEPGSWECTAAVRFKSPAAKPRAGRPDIEYGRIKAPTLLVMGARDNLRPSDFGEFLHTNISGSKLHKIPSAGHYPQIDEPAEFNRVVIQFLLAG